MDVQLAEDCPGIEIDTGVYSGCTANETGATDCPSCRGRTWPVVSDETWSRFIVGCHHCDWTLECRDVVDAFRSRVNHWYSTHQKDRSVESEATNE